MPDHPLELQFDVHYAESLEAAFITADCEEIDLILLDFESLKSNLMVVLQLLQLNRLTTGIPILLLTANAAAGETEQPPIPDEAFHQARIVGVVSKDLTPRELGYRIHASCAEVERRDTSQPEH